LKSSVIAVSGELSMTSVFDELAFAAPDDDADGLDEDEHAPRPAASRPAAVMAMSPRELR
jgi:hypothetical protein